MNLAESLCIVDLPGGPVVKNPLANAGDTGSNPDLDSTCLESLSPCATTTGAHAAAAAAKSLQSCPTLCDPIDGLLPGSSVPGILQARTLEWVAISFSNA